MPHTTVDVEALYAALDAKRRGGSKSWREVGRDLGISPSTFSRLANGRSPDVNSFATLLNWLGMKADDFMKPRPKTTTKTDPVAMFSTYLRADRRLNREDADALTNILDAAYKNLRKRKE
jgi:transcriptional regulator with XRE-family HTH domain